MTKSHRGDSKKPVGWKRSLRNGCLGLLAVAIGCLLALWLFVLSTLGCWLFGCWLFGLLAIGYLLWLLAFGFWLLGCLGDRVSPIVAGSSRFDARIGITEILAALISC